MIAYLGDYWDGRGAHLLKYGALSYGIAAFEWLLNPQNGLRVFPALKGNSAVDIPWGVLLWILPMAWLAVVSIGIKKAGWPGIILLLPIWWGLWWFNMMGMIFWYCATGRDCL